MQRTVVLRPGPTLGLVALLPGISACYLSHRLDPPDGDPSGPNRLGAVEEVSECAGRVATNLTYTGRPVCQNWWTDELALTDTVSETCSWWVFDGEPSTDRDPAARDPNIPEGVLVDREMHAVRIFNASPDRIHVGRAGRGRPGRREVWPLRSAQVVLPNCECASLYPRPGEPRRSILEPGESILVGFVPNPGDFLKIRSRDRPCGPDWPGPSR